ncbi:MAG: peptidoglycan DD-metalloendopeptidase family protein [Proteobacteria bacterium]|nr:peptidoglycan DD-metalloendopeptidase family protein [Pseudomonadota bacterium]
MKSALDKYLPEQRIYIRTDKSTRFLTLNSKSQLFIGIIATLSFSWLLIATAIIGYDFLEARSDNQRAGDQKKSFEVRVNMLSAERDRRALEAQTAQEQFYVALDQISEQQTSLLDAEEQRRELATGLRIMQTKLQDAVKSRDIAIRNSDQLLAELQDANGNKKSHLGAAEELNKTLALVSQELRTTVKKREFHAAEAAKAKQDVKEMAFDAELAQLKNEHIFSRIEDAIEVSLSPLERALDKSGINKDALLSDVRRGYSGTGGPLTELTISSKGVGSSHDGIRASGLLKALDRINLLKIAGNKVPLSNPIRGSYRYTSGFGGRRDPKNGGWRQHNGTDMAGPRGTKIVATADGVISFAGRLSGYGRLVKIKHRQGFETFYAHLNSINVKKGQKVSRGDKIGAMGNSGRSTGVHLHYEIRIDGKPVNAIKYIKAANDVF